MGSETEEKTGRSDVSDSHGMTGRAEEDSSGKLLKFHSGSVMWVTKCVIHLFFPQGGQNSNSLTEIVIMASKDMM